ncbi:uncharacterized protein LOC131889010 [Tigriopus californicus]|uniref:uncharacterized protein LOC131889010 n=1 Tax=Tigriopus californicus TaxID=6832 RepID=UPI0027DA24C8|nr:uncharacterized protein LOC131889010 [Tigriopus californicus]
MTEPSRFNPPDMGGVPVFNDLYESTANYTKEKEVAEVAEVELADTPQGTLHHPLGDSSLGSVSLGASKRSLATASSSSSSPPPPTPTTTTYSDPGVLSSPDPKEREEEPEKGPPAPKRPTPQPPENEGHSVCGVSHERRIFIGSLPPSLTEKPLLAHFLAFGPIIDCKVVRDRSTGISRGFAFLTFACESSAEKALNAERHVVEGKSILVSRVRNTPSDQSATSAINAINSTSRHVVEGKSILVSRVRNTPSDQSATSAINAINSTSAASGTSATSATSATSVKPPQRIKSMGFLEDIVLPNQRRIYIGPLLDDVTPSDLARQFAHFGVIQGISRLRGSGATTSRISYGFIDFQEVVSIRRAFASKVFVKGRHVKVALSRLAMEVALSESTVYFFEAHVYCDELHLENHFSPLGSIYRCLHFRQSTGQARSFGFVDYLDKHSADRACLNKSQLMYPGQFVRVSRALPQRYLWEFFAIGDTEANAIIKEMEKKIPTEGSWGGSNLRGFVNLKTPLKSKQVRIPSVMLPVLIGERGKTIAEICRDSKTQITLPRPDSNNPNVILTLRGTEPDLVTAQYLMQRILKAKMANP